MFACCLFVLSEHARAFFAAPSPVSYLYDCCKLATIIINYLLCRVEHSILSVDFSSLVLPTASNCWQPEPIKFANCQRVTHCVCRYTSGVYMLLLLSSIQCCVFAYSNITIIHLIRRSDPPILLSTSFNVYSSRSIVPSTVSQTV